MLAEGRLIMDFNVKVEYETPIIRSISIQCPECKKWFYQGDIAENHIKYSYEIESAEYKCPICDKYFGDYKDKPIIKECSSDEVYKDIVKKKVTWE
jgi:hypothetical protein